LFDSNHIFEISKVSPDAPRFRIGLLRVRHPRQIDGGRFRLGYWFEWFRQINLATAGRAAREKSRRHDWVEFRRFFRHKGMIGLWSEYYDS
jgi:hypothetical protein